MLTHNSSNEPDSAVEPNDVRPEDGPTAAPSPRRQIPGQRWIRLAALIGITVVAGLVVARVGLSLFQPHLYAGTIFQGDEPAPAMSGLIDDEGNEFDPADHEGEVVVVYFGYTNCPDVCPTALSDVNQAITQLDGDDADRTELVMVSVDPERDTPVSLNEYVGFFNDSFMGVTGSREDIDRAAALYGIFYQLNKDNFLDDEGTNYTVDHTANLMGIGPDGSLRILWSPDVSADQLAADIAELLS